MMKTRTILLSAASATLCGAALLMSQKGLSGFFFPPLGEANHAGFDFAFGRTLWSFTTLTLSAIVPFVVSCGGGGGGSSSADGNGANSNANLLMGMEFPDSGRGLNYLANSTRCAEIVAYTAPTEAFDNSTLRIPHTITSDGGYRLLTLTPNKPTGTLDVYTGIYTLLLRTTDASTGGFCSGNLIDEVAIDATFTAGDNNLPISLLTARWNFAQAIALNKTASSSSAQLSGFELRQGITSGGAYDDRSGFYDVKWSGSGFGAAALLTGGESLYDGSCVNDSTCYSEGDYTLTFKGPNTVTPKVDLWGFNLGTTAAGERKVFLAGGLPCDNTGALSCTFSITHDNGTSALNAVKQYSSVVFTSGSTMKGNVLEMLTTAWTEDNTCFADAALTTPITCPTWEEDAAKTYTATPALATGCLQNLRVTSNEVEQQFDPTTAATYYVRRQRTETLNICPQPFTATAQPGQMQANQPPVIGSFNVTPQLNAGEQNSLTWSITNPDNDPLSCAIYLNDNDTPIYAAAPCATTGTVPFVHTVEGVAQFRMVVSDGRDTAESIRSSLVDYAQGDYVTLPNTVNLPVAIPVGGTSDPQQFTITNNRLTDITIDGISLSGSGFNVDTTGVTFPVTLAPGQSIDFWIIFAPTVAGTNNATVSIASADFSGGAYSFGVTAVAGEVNATLNLGYTFTGAAPYVDNRTQCVSVATAAFLDNGTVDSSVPVTEVAVLTPAAPSTSLTLMTGMQTLLMTVTDTASGGLCSGQVIDMIRVDADLTLGSNTMQLHPMTGKWTFSTPIALNKSFPASTEVLSSFEIFPILNAVSAVEGHRVAKMTGANLPLTPLHWNGEQLEFWGGVCTSGEECFTEAGQKYSFTGPSTLTPQMHIDDIELAGIPAGKRQALLVAGDLSCGQGDPYTLDCTMSITDATTGADRTAELSALTAMTMTAAGTLTGTFFEILEKQTLEVNTCFADSSLTTEIPCPHDNATDTSVFTAVATLDASCITGLQVNEQRVEQMFDPQSMTTYYRMQDFTGQFDLCPHPFAATASHPTRTGNSLPEVTFTADYGSVPAGSTLNLNVTGTDADSDTLMCIVTDSMGGILYEGDCASVTIPQVLTAVGTVVYTVHVTDGFSSTFQQVWVDVTDPSVTGVALPPATYSYGTVPVGDNVTTTFTIQNNGSSSVTINGIYVADPSFFSVSASLPAVIPAGATMTFGVTFSPTVAESVMSTWVSIVSPDFAEPYMMYVSGVGGAVNATLNLGYTFSDVAAYTDNRSQCVHVVSASLYDNGTLNETFPVTELAMLTRLNPNASVPVMTGVQTLMMAVTDNVTDGMCGGQLLDMIRVDADFTLGTNSMQINPMVAKWTFTSPVTLNKSFSSSTEVLNSFEIFPSHGAREMYTHNEVKFTGANLPVTPLEWHGDYMMYNGSTCTSSTGCFAEATLMYTFTGPNVLKPQLDIDEIDLLAISAGERQAMIAGGDLSCGKGDIFTLECTMSITDATTGADRTAELQPLLNMTMTAAGTLSGTLMEVLQRSETETATCFADAALTTEIPCPHDNATTSTLFTAATTLDASCITGLRVDEHRVEQMFDSQSMTTYYRMEDYAGTFDICPHPFTATATPASTVPNSVPQVLIFSDFGAVPAGGQFTLSVTATDADADTLLCMVTDNMGGTVYEGSCSTLTLPMVVTAIGTVSYTVFATDGRRSSFHQIWIDILDPAVASVALPPASYDFGLVPVGDNVTSTFTIQNTGTTSVTISGISVADPSYFSISASLPAVIAAGDNMTFGVTFSPGVDISYTTLVSISSPDLAEPYQMFISGSGEAVYATSTVSLGYVFPGGNHTDPRTTCVEVFAPSMDQAVLDDPNWTSFFASRYVSGKGYLLMTLTPSLAVNTLELPPVHFPLEMRATDGAETAAGCAGATLDWTPVDATFTEGVNTFTISPLSGQWALNSPVTFNGTAAGSTETMTGFIIQDIQQQMHQPTGIRVFGSGFDPSFGAMLDPTIQEGVCVNGNTCMGESAVAYVLNGPSSVSARMQSDKIPLADMPWGARGFSFAGVPSGSIGGMNVAITDSLSNDLKPLIDNETAITFIGADTLSGAAVEIIAKTYSENTYCYTDMAMTNSIPCPDNVYQPTVVMTAAGTLSGNCISDVQISGTNNASVTFTAGGTVYLEKFTNITADLCFHPYTATAAPYTPEYNAAPAITSYSGDPVALENQSYVVNYSATDADADLTVCRIVVENGGSRTILPVDCSIASTVLTFTAAGTASHYMVVSDGHETTITSPANVTVDYSIGAGITTPTGIYNVSGYVPVGSANQYVTMSITNDRLTPMVITGINVDLTSVFTLSGLTFPITVQPFETFSFDIYLSPTAIGEQTGNFVIYSDVFSGGQQGFVLNVVGGASDVAAPATASFANSRVGDIAEQDVTISNNGNEHLYISSVTLANGTAFTVISAMSTCWTTFGGILPDNSTGVILPAGSSCTYKLTYASEDGFAGDSDLLTIASNDPDTPAKAVNIIGSWKPFSNSDLFPTSYIVSAPDAATDSAGVLHVAYAGNGVNYAYSNDNGATWTTEQIVRAEVHNSVRIDVDASDIPHVVWYDIPEQTLYHAKKVAGIWVTSTIDTGVMLSTAAKNDKYNLHQVSQIFDIAAGSGSLAVYYMKGSDLYTAAYSGVWSAPVSMGYTAVAVASVQDSAGAKHVIFTDGVNTYYSTNYPGSYTTSTLAVNANATQVDIAASSTGFVAYASYDAVSTAPVVYRGTAPYTGIMAYPVYSASANPGRLLEDAYGYINLQQWNTRMLLDNGTVLNSFSDNNVTANLGALLKKNNGMIAAVGFGYNPSDLRYSFSGVSTVIAYGTDGISQGLSAVISPADNTIHASFATDGQKNLYYANYDSVGDVWSSTVLASSTVSLTYGRPVQTDIALTAGGRPRIAYTYGDFNSAGAERVSVADMTTDGNWVVLTAIYSTIYNADGFSYAYGGATGYDTIITSGSDGMFDFHRFKADNGSVTTAVTYSRANFDAAQSVYGNVLSLRAGYDTVTDTHIATWIGQFGEIQVATLDNGTFSYDNRTNAADMANSYLSASVTVNVESIATRFDSTNGSLHLVYATTDGEVVHLERYNNGVWGMPETVSILGKPGAGKPSITLDADGCLHVSFYDPAQKKLKYGTNRSGTWITANVDTLAYTGRSSVVMIDNTGEAKFVYTDDAGKTLRHGF